jgi:hypothetical protein
MVRVEVPAHPSMLHILRTTAVSLAPPTTDVDRLSDLALAVSEAAVELLRLDGAGQVEMRIDDRPDSLWAALTISAEAPAGWAQNWEGTISALVLNSVVDDVRADSSGEQARVEFLFRPEKSQRVQ